MDTVFENADFNAINAIREALLLKPYRIIDVPPALKVGARIFKK